MKNPFNGGGDGKNKHQRVIDLYNNTPSLDWSLYTDEIIKKHQEYKLFLEKEAIKAMKYLHNNK